MSTNFGHEISYEIKVDVIKSRMFLKGKMAETNVHGYLFKK